MQNTVHIHKTNYSNKTANSRTTRFTE